MLKFLQFFGFLSLIIATSLAHSSKMEEVDPFVSQVSKFIIKLIEKYDTSQQGLLPIETYPLFLRDVFLDGSSLSAQTYKNAGLLLQATTQFTEQKKQKKEQQIKKQKQGNGQQVLQPDVVSIQQFYDDIIGKFTIFLMSHEQYQPIIDELFTDVETKKPEADKQEIQKQQL